MEKERLLSHFTGEDRELASRVLDQADISIKRAEPVVTDFFYPREFNMIKDLLHYIPEIKAMVFGGYRRAERQRFVIVPAYYLTESLEPPLDFLSVKPLQQGTFTHREVLGSITGLGLKREKIGDILVLSHDSGGTEAQVILAEEVGEFVLGHLKQVGSVQVAVERIDPEQLNVPPERVKEIKTTVASLRLDAVAGAGFGVSRTKMVREIKSEKVKVNWKTVTGPDYQVNVGDIISIKGRGRVEVATTTGLSKKGRVGLILKRYL